MEFLIALVPALIIILTLIILVSLAIAGYSAAPWVPLWQKDVQRMLELAKTKPSDLVLDLGAGDGRIVICAAKHFKAKAVGYEMAILPYLIAYIRITLQGLWPKISLKFANFFKADFSQADIICCFLTPAAMAKLKVKFEKETKPGCRIVSYAFAIPGWNPVVASKPDDKRGTIYLYQR